MRKLRLPRKITQRWIATVQFLAATPETHCFPVVLLEPRCVSAPFGSFPRARNPPLETRGMCTEFAGDHGLPRDPGIHLKTEGEAWGLAGSRERPGKTAGIHRVPLRERRFPTGSDRFKHCFFSSGPKRCFKWRPASRQPRLPQPRRRRRERHRPVRR